MTPGTMPVGAGAHGKDSLESHRARRRYSQNFLRDAGSIDRIVEAIEPRPDDRIVEIGPGGGALTAPLLARCEQLIAVEIDRDLAQMLARHFGSEGLTLRCADSLKADGGAVGRR